MKRVVVLCKGPNDVATVALEYDLAMHRVCIAELVRPSDGGLTRRVNPEALDTWAYPELDELINPIRWEWNWQEVNDFVTGYLNRQSEARVRLHEEWVIQLGQVL